AAAARRGTRAGPGTPDGRRGPADPAMAGTSARIADAGRGGPSRGRAAVPEVPVNRWSNGLARAWPMPTIDHRKTLCTAAISPQEFSLHLLRCTALSLTALLAVALPPLTSC